ncbi:unnamed protein product [Heligmosomoides polygyrus]|uniref:Reverse transcriptase domain-containing protein n=1 Tax=Heligmosomoides polygyrus TaxID=6339 RepID=A0A183GD95_HELPZ|nr:unnamed protein product [Heligmosomoides polygyrus]
MPEKSRRKIGARAVQSKVKQGTEEGAGECLVQQEGKEGPYAILENVTSQLEWEGIGVKVVGRQLHHLRFADDIVLITPSISETERMLADFDCCSSYAYLAHEVNMAYNLAPELSRRKRAVWGAFKSVEEVAKKTKNVRLRAHLFDSTVLPILVLF